MRKYVVFAVVVAALAGLLAFVCSRCRSLSGENERLRGNLGFYESTERDNTVLRLTVDELRNSRDSLVVRVDSLREALSIRPRTIQAVTVVETYIHDTLRTEVTRESDFDAVIRPNDLTRIEIVKRDTLLTVVPDIRNEQVLYVTRESRYKYKGFLNRLVHFNFKKITTDRYHIENTNDLISVGDTRVINVVK